MPVIVAAVAAVSAAIGAVGSAIAAGLSVVGGALATGFASIGLGALGAGLNAFVAGTLASGIGVLFGSAGIGAAIEGWVAVGSVASVLFGQPNLNTGAPVSFKADINAPLPYVVGRTGVGGNVVFTYTSGNNNDTLHYFTVLSHGPVTAFEQFSASNIPVTFQGAPNYGVSQVGLNWRGAWNNSTFYRINDGVSFSGSDYIAIKASTNVAPPNATYWSPITIDSGHPWIGRMFMVELLGHQPEVAFPSSGALPAWTSAHKLSGLAAAHWSLNYDSKAYGAGTPKPIWVISGPAVYDPRLDSTYPGGSGAQRWNDETTWAFSENPYLHGLAWVIGRKNNGVKVLGVGAPVGAIDVAAFVAGANVADANAWKVGGQVTSGDSKWDVLVGMLQAGGGTPIRLGAKISCIVQTPRTSIATLDASDIVGPVSIQATVKRADRINRVIPSYREEALGWTMAPAAAYEVAAYKPLDGGTRTKGLDFPLVQDVDQVTQLAAYAIYDSREFGPITLPCKPQWQGLQPGDAITLDEDEWGLSNQLCMIFARKVDPATGIVNLTLRSETTAKHAAALGLTGALITPAPLVGIDLISQAPNTPPWSAVGATLTAGGVAIPAIVVTGSMENPNATNLVVQYRVHGTTDWTHYDSPPAPAASRVELQLASTQGYDIGLSYLVRGIQGAQLVFSNITAGTFAASGAGANPTCTTFAQGNITASGGNPTSVSTGVWTCSGPNETVNWVPTWTGTATCQYSKNAGALTTVASGSSIPMNSGDTLQLTFTHTTVGANTGTVTLANATDSGANLLTTANFTYSITVSNTISDGTVLETYTTPGAWAVTSASNWPAHVTIELWAAGGGGTMGYPTKGAANPGWGGGGGGYRKLHLNTTPGTTSLGGAVGGGGAGGGAIGASGATGADTTLTAGGTSTAHGGVGAASSTEGAGGSGGSGDAANVNGRAGGLTHQWDGGGAGDGSGDQVATGAAGTMPGGGGAGGANDVEAGGGGAGGKVVITAGWV